MDAGNLVNSAEREHPFKVDQIVMATKMGYSWALLGEPMKVTRVGWTGGEPVLWLAGNDMVPYTATDFAPWGPGFAEKPVLATLHHRDEEARGGAHDERFSEKWAEEAISRLREPHDQPSSPVVLPHHYTRFKIEPIYFIMENALSFEQGCVVKYVCRYDAKDGVQDLKKARRYLDMMIAKLEGNPTYAG